MFAMADSDPSTFPSVARLGHIVTTQLESQQ